MNKLRYIFLGFTFLLFFFSVNAQDSLFGAIKFSNLKCDTIYKDFVIEVNSKFKYYASEHLIFQQNLIFPEVNDFLQSPSTLYFRDTVVIFRWDRILPYLLHQKYYDEQSLDTLFLRVILYETRKKNRRLFERNRIQGRFGMEYMRFRAKLVVVNVGVFEWNIPWILCDNSEVYVLGNYSYCKRVYKNTLIPVKVISFKYHSEIRKKN